MKKLIVLLLIFVLLLSGCSEHEAADIVATTLPIFEFTSRLCEGSGIRVTQLITENVSCLHDYTLKVAQMRLIEQADLVVINGAGLEDFMEDALSGNKNIISADKGLSIIEAHGHHEHAGQDHTDHDHSQDPHIWLSPRNAITMVDTICQDLCDHYPQQKDIFLQNREVLISELSALQSYAEQKLSSLSCRKLITFHDGFGYLAESFNLEIIKAIEEESGAEASAQELIELIAHVRENNLPAIFTEINGASSAASIISAETGAKVFPLDMAMSGSSYFESMYHNIDTLREALQ